MAQIVLLPAAAKEIKNSYEVQELARKRADLGRERQQAEFA
jgi:hypothetical protein